VQCCIFFLLAVLLMSMFYQYCDFSIDEKINDDDDDDDMKSLFFRENQLSKVILQSTIKLRIIQTL